MGFKICALDHLVLRVRDIERSVAFYRDVLGLTVHFLDELRRGERAFVSVRVGEQLVDLVPDPRYDPDQGSLAGGFLHLCFRFEGPDFPELLAQLQARGVDVVSPLPALRDGATGRARSVYVRDPDGYTLELKREEG